MREPDDRCELRKLLDSACTIIEVILLIAILNVVFG